MSVHDRRGPRRRGIVMSLGLFVLGVIGSSPLMAAPPSVHVTVEPGAVGMGRSVRLEATATLPGGQPAAGYLLLPYVNGRRWGAHDYADARGHAVFHLPLPQPGVAGIEVEALAPRESWIWAPRPAPHQTIWLQHAFDLDATPTDARLWVGVDDVADVLVNGRSVGKFNGWNAKGPVPNVTGLLKRGRNVLSVEAYNGDLPAGFVLRLELDTPAGPQIVKTGPGWTVASTRPAGWPAEGSQTGEKVRVLSPLEEGNYSGSMGRWPDNGRGRLITGTRAPEGAALSNRVDVAVKWRRLDLLPADPAHLVGAQYCSLFTPMNFNWTTAQAVPLVGFYRSWDTDVLRQHLIWLAESGVDFLLLDWSNQLWDCKHWDDRTDAANEIVHTTTMLLETAATMRDQGLPVPRMVIFVGLNNGPSATMEAIKEESAWIYHNYVRNPRFRGLFLEYLGKPMLIVFNGGGPEWLKATKQPPVDERYFTIRWMSSQHQLGPHNKAGYWSWMDGNLRQPYTLFQGKPEVLTVSVGFFDEHGWTAPSAFGRRGGWTYVESFRSALEHRPRFLQLHQFQEFTGALEGTSTFYGDSYSVELSDDIEPVSPTTPAYRGNGGWGFQYLNLTRALVDLYRQPAPETTVLAIAQPLRGAVVSGDELPVEWTALGKPPTGYTLLLNGQPVARGLSETRTKIDVSRLPDGPAVLRLAAEGATMRYPLAIDREALPQTPLVPAMTEVEFMRQRAGAKR